jgi:hypothetical protein
MTTRRSVCRAGTKNQGVGSAGGVTLGDALLLAVAEFPESGSGLRDGEADVAGASGLGFTVPVGRAAGVVDWRTDADGDGDGDGDARTWRCRGVLEVTTCGASAGAVCGATGAPDESVSSRPRPPVTATKVPVADAAITLATASAAITRRGSRNGAQMLSRSGSGWPYQLSASPSKVPLGTLDTLGTPKVTGALAPSKPMTGPTPARFPVPAGVPVPVLALDSMSALDRWSRS